MNFTNYQLYTDGSHFNHLQVSGIGGVLFSPAGEKQFEFSEIITNKQDFLRHEILALEKGLLLCLEKKIFHVDCYSDDQSLCTILNLHEDEQYAYVEKNPFLNKILDLKEYFQHLSFTYIPRKQNKIADLLSHQEIYDTVEEKNLILDCGAHIPNLYCTEQYIKKDKYQFQFIRQLTQHYLVVEIEGLQFNLWKTNRYDLGKTLLCKKTLPKFDSIANIIYELSDKLQTLIDNGEKHWGLMILGRPGIDKLLKGVVPLTRNTQYPIQYLSSVCKQMEGLILNHEQDIFEYFSPKPSIKIIKTEFKNNLEAFYLDALKTLGQKEYILGQNKIIEQHFKKTCGNPLSLQKKYFGELLKLKMKHTPDISRDTAIQTLKEEIKQRGIHLRY